MDLISVFWGTRGVLSFAEENDLEQRSPLFYSSTILCKHMYSSRQSNPTLPGNSITYNFKYLKVFPNRKLIISNVLYS